MKINVEVPIQGCNEDIWKVITDIENSPANITGIQKVEIHDNLGESLVGLKWTETRTLFGKTATETMWITEAEKNKYYKTRAESHGAVYTTLMNIFEKDGETYLGMEFNSEAQSFAAKLMAGVFGSMFKNATKKALHQDLLDIKNVVEGKNAEN
jgi:carbon monoxide dehydrogenase subunit G